MTKWISEDKSCVTFTSVNVADILHELEKRNDGSKVTRIIFDYACPTAKKIRELGESDVISLSNVTHFTIENDFEYELPPKEQFADLLPNLISLTIMGSRWWDLCMDEKVPHSVEIFNAIDQTNLRDVCRGMKCMTNLREMTLDEPIMVAEIASVPCLEKITFTDLLAGWYLDNEEDEIIEEEQTKYLGQSVFDSVRARFISVMWSQDTSYGWTLVITLGPKSY